MESINCNLCGADDTELVYLQKDRLLKLPGSFRLVQCRQCGLLYLNPRPTPQEIATYYPPEYNAYSIAPEDRRSRVDCLDASFGYWKRARSVTKARPRGGRLLDIGCATGNFLHALRRLGPWDVEGLDVSFQAAEYARNRYGLEVFVGELAQARYPDSCFDAVTMWNVLEHLHDPKGTLQEVYRILKPNGLLVVGTPNLWSIDARLFGPFWLGLDAPRHLYIFSPATLQKLLQETGFHVEKICSFGGYHPFAFSLQFWLDEGLQHAGVKQPLFTLLHSRVFRLLTLPYFALLRKLNKTSGMTVFASSDKVRPAA